jgi:hypothetical protein
LTPFIDELVVVLAGYPDEMDELMAHNPGVRSRFPTVILFEDYNVRAHLKNTLKDAL